LEERWGDDDAIRKKGTLVRGDQPSILGKWRGAGGPRFFFLKHVQFEKKGEILR